MKKITSILSGMFLAALCLAQTPDKISYQLVVHNSNNQLVANQMISVQISIIRGESTVVYTESQTQTTNSNGLVTLELGTQAGFSTIDWADGPYFIKTEVDPTGGTNYSIIQISEIQSVPYALHAKTVENISDLNAIVDKTAFNNWDKDNSNDFDGQYSNLTGSPTSVSEFTNNAGYISSESDTKFNESEAKNISASDIQNLENLSGINSGDEDLSDFALKAELADTAALIRQYIKNKDSNSEIDPVFIESESFNITAIDITNLDNLSGTNTGDQDLSQLISNETDPIFAASNAAEITGSDIANLDNLSGSNTGDQDISHLSTESELENTASSIREDLPLADGSETHLTAGTDFTISGTGTNVSPYVINASRLSDDAHYIGELYGGGIVFWVTPDGQHGLIASLHDLDNGHGAYWSAIQDVSVGSAAHSMTDGSTNTAAMVAFDNTDGYAATLCNNYTGGGYTDWYLPSIRELVLLGSQDILIDYILDNDGDSNTEGFIQEYKDITYGRYWSSTESSNENNTALLYLFRFTHSKVSGKQGRYRIRAIREF